MIILGQPDTNPYSEEENYEDSYYYDNDEYEYDEFGGWFKKIRKKITPKRIIKGLFMPHTLMPHNLVKKHIISKTPIGKAISGIENKALSAIGFGKSRPRLSSPPRPRNPRILVRPSQPIKRGGAAPNIRYKSSVASNQLVGANQLLNQQPVKGIAEPLKTETIKSEPKKAGIGNSTIAIAVVVLLVGGYVAFGRKAPVPTAPVPPVV